MTRSHEPEIVGESAGEMIECCREPAEEVCACVEEKLSVCVSVECPTVELGIYSNTQAHDISRMPHGGERAALSYELLKVPRPP